MSDQIRSPEFDDETRVQQSQAKVSLLAHVEHKFAVAS
jgi:hypothetical protein